MLMVVSSGSRELGSRLAYLMQEHKLDWSQAMADYTPFVVLELTRSKT
jgi:hypothetical protein